MRYPPRYEVLKNAFVDKRINKRTGKLSSHYKCAKCKKVFPTAEVQVDHKKPVSDPATGFTTFDDYVARLYCSAANLQIICKPCHEKKTAKEREEAWKIKRQKSK